MLQRPRVGASASWVRALTSPPRTKRHTPSLQYSSASARSEHQSSQAPSKNVGIAKSLLFIMSVVPSVRADVHPCLDGAFNSISLCHPSVFTWGPIRSAPFGGMVPYRHMALEKPSNVPLPCFLLLPRQLSENIHFAVGLENLTRWNSGNQVCNPKSSASQRQITSLFLSLSICHLGYTKSAPRRCTGENRVEEVPILLTHMCSKCSETLGRRPFQKAQSSVRRTQFVVTSHGK